jgi:methyltransferase family protein
MPANQTSPQEPNASSILPRLFSIYRAAGYEPVTGHSPFHFFNWRDAPFTRFAKGQDIHGMAGIALQEVMFMEHFRGFISPRRILIIGNAYGWSTIALSLIFPDARVVAMDPDPVGVELTNRLADANGLSAKAVVSRSPDDVSRIVNEHLDGPVEFSLIDAIHNNDAIKMDFSAVRAFASANAQYLFHDIINWNMIDGFRELLAAHQLQGKVFARTESGMALAYTNLSSDFSAYLDCFADPPGLFSTLRLHAVLAFLDPVAAYQRYDSRPR